MILELSVENIAVIEKAQIGLGPGFTVLTGETGAGKSLLVDAIALALGGRADADLLRAGAQKGPVHLVATITNNPAARALCDELGVSPEEDTIFIVREISSEGRNVSRINGKAHPVSSVKQLGSVLVDLHGQHDHQALLDPVRHLEYLDLWIGAPLRPLLDAVSAAYDEWHETQEKLNTLRKAGRDREHRIDLLSHQVSELSEAGLRVGELEELQAQLVKSKHAAAISEATYSAISALDDEEISASGRLAEAITGLHSVQKYDEDLAEIVSILESAETQLKEALLELRNHAEELGSESQDVEEIAERLDKVKRILRKYGDDEQSALEFLAEAEQELSLLSDAESSEVELLSQLKVREQALNKACSNLTELRTQSAANFSALVQSEIQELAMAKAKFEVAVLPSSPSRLGADSIQFMFSANTGEPLRALDKIASGGEMSRVMLALKVALAGKAGVPTLIFDEIDTGLSGFAAAVVARKLSELSKHYQVVAISHLPQLAGRADVHFKIEKNEREERTFTEIRKLEGEERVRELARMLAGEEIGEMAIANARELLAST